MTEHASSTIPKTGRAPEGPAKMGELAPLNEAVRRRMQHQRRRDTSLELRLRRRLHAMGYRYRVDHRPTKELRCRGDIVFTRRKLVVFVDGCFWHGCPVHAAAPKNNADWWRAKLAANVARDSRNTAALEELEWAVIRIWEHEPLVDAVARIQAALASDPTGKANRRRTVRSCEHSAHGSLSPS